MAARNPVLELGLPCIGEPPYYRRGGQEDTIAEEDRRTEGGEGEADLR